MSLLSREGARCAVDAATPEAEIVELSAVQLAQRIRSRELSPVEVIDAYLTRADRVQETLNPFTWRDADLARESARKAEQLLGAPEDCGPLAGVPVAVKELTPVAGLPWTLGSLAFRDQVAEVTDPAIQRLLDAGAIVHARTNTPEFGCASVTDNLLYGETLNPWNPAFSPAGSSGGAATALAVHATPLAQGTDSAGSLRLPASACGVVGMKPSHAVVPILSPGFLDSNNHNGPMARDVADLRLMFDVMAGPDDAMLYGHTPIDRPGQVQPRQLRIGVIDAMADLDVDPDVAANLHRAGRLLETAGATVEQAAFPWSYERLFAAARMIFAQYYAPMARRAVDLGTELNDYTRAFSDSMVELTDDYTVRLAAREENAELHRALGQLMKRFDVLLLPTLAAPAYPAGDHFIDHGPIVQGREQPDRWIVGFTIPFNLVSCLPVVSVPSGLSREGLPTGAQVVARPYHDHTAIDVAALVESLIDDADS